MVADVAEVLEALVNALPVLGEGGLGCPSVRADVTLVLYPAMLAVNVDHEVVGGGCCIVALTKSIH